MTNGDFIRSLPNEKLSTWIAEHTGCSDWCHLYDKCKQKPENHCCINVWFDWLEAEHTNPFFESLKLGLEQAINGETSETTIST